MLRRAVLAFLPALLLPLSAKAADPELPALDAEGRTLPLRADQLDPAEREAYAGLATPSDDARQFLYTRGFLRYARLVADGKLPPANLPPLPLRANWNRKFLSQSEATGVLDVAIGMKLATRPRMAAAAPLTVHSPDLPGVDAEGRCLPLRVEQLRPEERTAYDRLDPSGDDARQFLFTRGFLRYAQLVVDGKMDPKTLPKLPARVDWDRQFLDQHESKEVLDVALGMSFYARMTPSQ